jgi:membrane associated rhomboid family serine protease
MGLYNRDYMRMNERGRGFPGRLSMLGWLMLACVAVFIYQMMIGEGALEQIKTPGAVTLDQLLRGQVWRLLTYPFVHGHALHLIINMLWLWLIGRFVAEDLGSRHLLGLFFSGAILGALVDLPVYPENPLVGASAGVWALMVAMTLRFPEMPVGFPFLPGVTLRLKNLTLGLLIFEVISATAQFFTRHHTNAFRLDQEHVASLAHLGGALGGWIYTKVLTGGFAAMVRQSEERERWWREERARRREPTRVVAGRRTTPSEVRETPPVDFIEEMVDPILEKLHAHGRDSLSAEEKRILDEAARRLNRSGRH